MSDHNELECDGLHEEMSYSIKAYGISRGSLALKEWFDKVFTFENPKIAECYSVVREERDTGENQKIEVIEIMAYEPHIFTCGMLEAMFLGNREEQREAKILKSVGSN